MGGHGHGGGGHHGGGHGGRRGGWRGWAPPFPVYYDEEPLVYAADNSQTSTLYRGYVITQAGARYTVAKAGSTLVLASFASYDEARAYIDHAAGVSGLGANEMNTPAKLMTAGVIAGAIYLAFMHEPKHRSRR